MIGFTKPAMSCWAENDHLFCPTGAPGNNPQITFSAADGVPVGRKMITFSVPQEVRKSSRFVPHRDWPPKYHSKRKALLYTVFFRQSTKQRILQCFLFRLGEAFCFCPPMPLLLAYSIIGIACHRDSPL